MSLNSTPSSERVHIGFFGRRNAGKSSVVNAVTGQDLAVVSDVAGTTTDPVSKAMELLPLGPVIIIDTPGIDDEGKLGELRVRKTKQVLNKIDLAVLVIDAEAGISPADEELVRLFREKELPYLIVYNKMDLLNGQPEADRLELLNGQQETDGHQIFVSALEKKNIYELKERIAALAKKEESCRRIVADLIQQGDLCVLVTPIDSAAPKGRLILPQQQTIRDILEADAVSVVVKENGLRAALERLGEPPAVVITDSQAFGQVAVDTPESIKLTSFSILFARYKGILDKAVEGVTAIKTLRDGDKVLISEGCTHHRQCDDIGSVKIPRWLKEFTGKDLKIELTSGTEFPEDLSEYRLIIHCGGCMLNEREMRYRLKCAADQGVPMTNYGIAIAYMKGILKRSVEIFPHLYRLL
ncbi:MAG: [FeFe] hydrogenase H-cluster maturation GTPase HydF [Eubacterium sp.]|jgi:hydrogenase maturation GTPase HydF|nr:[FeFe] hydrogenase H-cluster maturation GTPase HydF [Eubacterium sp.]